MLIKYKGILLKKNWTTGPKYKFSQTTKTKGVIWPKEYTKK